MLVTELAFRACNVPDSYQALHIRSTYTLQESSLQVAYSILEVTYLILWVT